MAAMGAMALRAGVAVAAMAAFTVETVVGRAGLVEGWAAEAAGMSVFHAADIGLDISGVKIYRDCN